MPKVGQSYLDARRKQIVDAARNAIHQRRFRRNLNGHIVTEPSLHRSSTGISRARNEIVVASVSREPRLPTALTLEPSRTSWSMSGFGP